MFFKKPKYWDKKRTSLLSILLLPFTVIIILSNVLKNLNNNSNKKSEKIFSLCVGNIYLGGTGKTPTTIKIYNLLKKINKSVVTAKKFNSSHLDEIKLLKNNTEFIADTSRKKIIKKATEKKFEVVVFDDGLQDRGIYYDLKAVCFDSKTWIGNGHLIPSGPLREKFNNLKKYELVFIKNVTKSENTNKIRMIKKVNSKIKVFNSYYKITNIRNFNRNNKYLIYSGIGHSDGFKDLLKIYKFKVTDHIIFPDHYFYKKDDFLKIFKTAKKLKAKIITTEKDYIKVPEVFRDKINVIKIDLIIKNQKKLIQFLKYKINEKN
jgi:tetraacyldisaccharide 4'-kinase